MTTEDFDDQEEQLADIVTTDNDVPKMEVEGDAEPISDEEIERGPREDIYAKYDEKQNKELGAETETAAEPEAEPENEVEEEQEDGADDPASEEDLGAEEEPETVTAKIYGEERKVSKAEVEKAGGLDAYQIITATRERLDETNRMREELKAEKEKLAKERDEWETTRQAEVESAQKEKEQAASDELADLYEQLEAARIDADTEEAAKLQRQIDDSRAAAANKQQPNLKEMIEEHLIAYDREADRQRGIAWFNETHKELAEDPELRAIVHNKVVAMGREYPQAPKSEIIKEAAQNVAEWWETQTAPAQQTSERVEKKRRLRQPKAASARQQLKAEPTPPTRSEVVAQMRRDRGLED